MRWEGYLQHFSAFDFFKPENCEKAFTFFKTNAKFMKECDSFARKRKVCQGNATFFQEIANNLRVNATFVRGTQQFWERMQNSKVLKFVFPPISYFSITGLHIYLTATDY